MHSELNLERNKTWMIVFMGSPFSTHAMNTQAAQESSDQRQVKIDSSQPR
jgi:hypothetical protein